MTSKTIVIAIGGNSLIEKTQDISVSSQFEAARRTAVHIVRLAAEGHRIIIAHGNGPQVGFVLRRSEFSRKILHTVPLDSCVADTQGAIGYNLQMAIYNEAKKIGIQIPAATIITQVEVNPHDPSFRSPTKPIGSFMNKEDAEYHRETDGWHIMEDAGRGYRRVVPSPFPISIIEIEIIKKLSGQGALVIAAGGGGIPVIKTDKGLLKGKEAVVDKDFSAALMAKELQADLFVISTAIDKVCINFGKDTERKLDRISCSEAEQYSNQGHFAPGSMLPKIKAVINFVSSTGNEGIITDPKHLYEAIYSNEGTHIVP
ncbi:MAG: carbamate kinase [Spirochaetales bacterium]|nr:carbamate kinase [Spirochaetales bacterium]